MKQLIILLSLVLSFQLMATSKLQKVEKLIYLMDVENQIKLSLQKIAMNLRNYSSIKSESRFKEVMNQIINMEDLVEYQKKQYMTKFKEDEIDDIIRFYESKGGKRLRRVSPELLSDTMQFAHEMIKKKAHLLKN